MKDQIQNFQIGEPINPGGYTIVHRATQQMGHGVTRPAAIKILQVKDRENEEQIATLIKEVGLLVEVSTSPHIVSVYDFNFDSEIGPWIAMELGGRSLKEFIKDEPADPNQVRVLLRDCLRGLDVCHRCEPPILHRDIKPNNILASEHGGWMIADFGLAKRRDADDTLNVVTVQYASPELLDATRGPDSPRMDIYSLGMVAYELAIGRTLYRQQFPSVYDPYADPEAAGTDLRPKWMYWHTSMEMTVPPVKQLLPEFPEELSDLIEAMTLKPYSERIDSAAEALRRLGDVQAQVQLEDESVEEAGEEASSSQRTLLLAVTTVGLMIALAAFLYFQYLVVPAVTFDSPRFSGVTPEVKVTGLIENFPDGGLATVTAGEGSAIPALVSGDGRFAAAVPLPTFGEFLGLFEIRNNLRQVVTTRQVTLERLRPESVALFLITAPKSLVTLGNLEANPEDVQHHRTDQSGNLRVTLPYGSFDMQLQHGCFEPFGPQLFRPRAETLRFEGGEVTPEWQLKVSMEPLSSLWIDQKRMGFLDEVSDLAPAAAGGEQEARLRLEAIKVELDQIKDCGSSLQGEYGDRKQALLDELDAAINGALNGDEDALNRVNAIRDELQQNDEDAEQDSANLGRPVSRQSDENRQADLKKQAAEMDKRIADLAARAAAGDPEAAAELAKLIEERKALQEQIGGDDPLSQEVMNRLNKMQDAAVRAAAGDTSAMAELGEEAKKYVAARIAEEAQGDPEKMVQAARDLLGGDANAVELLGRAILMNLPIETFRAFIDESIPSGALSTEILNPLPQVRIQGPVFDDREQELLMTRLNAAMPKLQIEVRVDGWDVCKTLEKELKERGIPGVRVHAHLRENDHILFVLYDGTTGTTKDEVFQVARNYVVDPNLLTVTSIPEELFRRIGEDETAEGDTDPDGTDRDGAEENGTDADGTDSDG